MKTVYYGIRTVEEAYNTFIDTDGVFELFNLYIEEGGSVLQVLSVNVIGDKVTVLTYPVTPTIFDDSPFWKSVPADTPVKVYLKREDPYISPYIRKRR